jgi:hypothetical protein
VVSTEIVDILAAAVQTVLQQAEALSERCAI